MKFELQETDVSGLEHYLKTKEVIKPFLRLTSTSVSIWSALHLLKI